MSFTGPAYLVPVAALDAHRTGVAARQGNGRASAVFLALAPLLGQRFDREEAQKPGLVRVGRDGPAVRRLARFYFAQ